MKKRQSGVLMHISSLPGAYGIGSFGQTAYDFVDFLVRTKQRYWQILPLGTTSYGDSPYQSFSAFAGNTHFIDLDILVEQGLLEASDLKGVDFGSDASEVDYAKIYYARRPLLEKAVKRFLEVGDVKDFEKFAKDNQSFERSRSCRCHHFVDDDLVNKEKTMKFKNHCSCHSCGGDHVGHGCLRLQRWRQRR